MNEIVKYSNELHELKFNSLTEAQQNVFLPFYNNLEALMDIR